MEHTAFSSVNPGHTDFCAYTEALVRWICSYGLPWLYYT